MQAVSPGAAAGAAGSAPAPYVRQRPVGRDADHASDLALSRPNPGVRQDADQGRLRTMPEGPVAALFAPLYRLRLIDGLRPIGSLHPAHDIPDMDLYRAFADTDLICNGFVGLALPQV